MKTSERRAGWCASREIIAPVLKAVFERSDECLWTVGMKTQSTSKLRTPTRVVCLIAVYFLAGWVGKRAAFMDGDVALVWPHAGIALAAVILFGYRFLPGVAIGAFLFSVMDGKPLGFFTFGTALGNCIGATICAYLLQKSVGFQSRMERTRDAVSFIALAALFGTTINALFNVASVYAGGQMDWENLGSAFLVWWIPNAMGCLVVAPLLLTWSHFQIPRWSGKRAVELAVCAAGLVTATVFSFESWYAHGITQYPLAFLPYPFVVWAALRFGVRGATLSTLVVAAVSIHAVLGKRGPFVLDSEVQTLLLVGSYIAVVAIANLLLAASAAERSASELRYRAVVEDQTESICRFDRRGNLTFVNDAFCRSRGKSRRELMDTSFLPQVSTLDLEIPLATFLQLVPEDPLLTYDARVSTAQGLGWEQCDGPRGFRPRPSHQRIPNGEPGHHQAEKRGRSVAGQRGEIESHSGRRDSDARREVLHRLVQSSRRADLRPPDG